MNKTPTLYINRCIKLFKNICNSFLVFTYYSGLKQPVVFAFVAIKSNGMSVIIVHS